MAQLEVERFRIQRFVIQIRRSCTLLFFRLVYFLLLKVKNLLL